MRKHFFFLCALIGLLALCACARALGESAETADLPYSRVIDVPGAGSISYYAQNDPLWANALYDARNSTLLRKMRGSGCGPANIAMAIARQVTAQALPGLIDQAYAPEIGFPFCVCSVNGYRCNRKHGLTTPTTPEQFSAYLPVIFASYALGNNTRRIHYRDDSHGTSLLLFEALAKAYGLAYSATTDMDEVFAALKRGASVISTTTGLFVRTSHYLFLVSVHDGYLYMMDSMMRGGYPLDRRKLIEVVEPGLVRVSLSNLKKIPMYGFYIIESEAEE